MEPIVYPPLMCPFPCAINPFATEAQQATIAWARGLRLLQREAAYRRLNRLQYGMLMARAYPSAAPETLQIVTDWSTWLWDLHTRILAHAPEGWHARFSRSVTQYFTANVWEATNRRQGQIPDAASYCAMRLFTSAVYPCLLLIELTEGLRLPSEVYDNPDVQRLAKMTNNVISWANDIVSLEKERRQGDVHNLALILSHEQKLSLQAAVDRVGALHDAEVYACALPIHTGPAYGCVET
jgi:hypothetical protein